MLILESSAVLALLFGEAGAAQVGEAVGGARVSAVNRTAVIARLQRSALPLETFEAMGLPVVPFGPAEADLAGELLGRHCGVLSLGDAACLATARMLGVPALTADRAWAAWPAGAEVRLIRGQRPHPAFCGCAPAARAAAPHFSIFAWTEARSSSGPEVATSAPRVWWRSTTSGRRSAARGRQRLGDQPRGDVGDAACGVGHVHPHRAGRRPRSGGVGCAVAGRPARSSAGPASSAVRRAKSVRAFRPRGLLPTLPAPPRNR